MVLMDIFDNSEEVLPISCPHYSHLTVNHATKHIVIKIPSVKAIYTIPSV